MNIKGQGHPLNLVQCRSYSTFSNFYFLETAWPTEAKFNVESPLSLMTKMNAMSIYDKNL